jgi:SAM-dependent methyltransferase
VLDISPRVLDHVAKAKARAARGQGYTLNLPLAKTKPWLPDVRKYWETFGDQIGTPAAAPQSKTIAAQADLRAVRLPSSVVQRLSAVNLNIVTDRLDGEAFDLAIATNVFIYYDALEQALALANVEAMLKPGGFLLANFAAPELTSLTIRKAGSLTTRYSGLADNAEYILDVMVWYRAHADLAH